MTRITRESFEYIASEIIDICESDNFADCEKEKILEEYLIGEGIIEIIDEDGD